MSSIILCATDLTDQGRRAAAYAGLFARAVGGEVVLLHATGTASDGSDAVPDSMGTAARTLERRMADRLDQARRALEAQRAECAGLGVACETALVEGRPSEVIERVAGERGAGLVVLGRRADRNAGYVGPTIHHVVRHAPCPILVAPPEGAPPESFANGRWVVGIDFSRPSDAALAAVRALVGRCRGEVLLAQVAAPPEREEELAWGRRTPQQVLREESLNQDAQKLEELARTQGYRAVQRVSLERPADELLSLADEVDATMIVVGSHGRTGLGRFFLGSVGDRLLRASRRAVMVVREIPPEIEQWFEAPDGEAVELGPSHVLVAFDMSEPSERALSAACDLAARLDVALDVVHVYEPPTEVRSGLVGRITTGLESPQVDPGTLERIRREVARRVASVLGDRGATAHVHVEVGRPVARIMDAARRLGADLVVVGTTGRSGVTRALLGSVAETLVRRSPVPVLTVH